MSYGFVYLARNASMPGLYKIGSTSNSPRSRIQQLSQPTAVPTPFSLMGYCELNGYLDFEKTLHCDYSQARNSSSREFFNLSSGQIKEIGWIFSITGDSYWLDIDEFSDQVNFMIKREMEVLA